MRSKISSVLSTVMIGALCAWAAPGFAVVVEPAPQDRELARIITRELERRHLAAETLFDSRRPQVGQLILNAFDPSRSLLTEEDLFRFPVDLLPDQIERGSLDSAYRLYNLTLKRQRERGEYWLSLLDSSLSQVDLTDDESLAFRDAQSEWLPNTMALQQLWRQQLENAVINLALANRTPADIEKALRRRFISQLNRLEQTRPTDAFETVVNAYARAYDPHTQYLPPADSETFNINMSLSLQGIGAVLQTEDEFTKVVSIIPGGPAQRDGRIKPADRILSVGQENAELEDVVGWRLDEVVSRIRGAKGSLVKLEIQSGDGDPPRVIEIIRDRVQLEEQSAKKHVLELNEGRDQVGVITVPTFYSDFAARQAGDPNYRSTTRDVARLLSELRAEGVTSLVLDLRNNGGGSLQEAYELFGLFIETGPVVQIRSSGGQTDVRGDRDPEIAWDGPLLVLVNRLSASASEIFAGAVQDYGRGLVVGSQTFGKGTVQALLPMADGQLKLTIAKFYRISGESTQHKGVIPDISFPSPFDSGEIGESALENALPWDQIRPLRYRQLGDIEAVVPPLLARHQARIQTDPNFQALAARANRAIELSKEAEISLQLEARQAERAANEAWTLTLENTRRKALGLAVIESIDVLEAEATTNRDNPAEDAAILEGAQILLDAIRLSPRLAETAAGPLPRE
jgi:carboxyl-terminal processing protease